MRNIPHEKRYNYFRGIDRSQGSGKVGYFAGCMTHLTPAIIKSMTHTNRYGGPTRRVAYAAVVR